MGLSTPLLDVPVITKSSFIWSEHDIGEWWREELQESMIAARKEENWLTEERGEYHEGVSAISVRTWLNQCREMPDKLSTLPREPVDKHTTSQVL